MDYILFLLGAVFIFIGSNLLIDNSKLIAISLGVSPFVIGLTLIAFGTSLPELIVSTMASFSGEGDIVLGNVLGSNIANIALVLSIIVLFKTIKFNSSDLKSSLGYIATTTLILIISILYNNLTLIPGLAFLVLFIMYIYDQFKIIKQGNDESDNTGKISFKIKYLFYSFIGISLLGWGSNLFINGAIGIAVSLGVPLIVISLSIVALGTSIPELVTSLVAINKNESNLVLGNILGSNIINLVLVLGSSIIINPITIYDLSIHHSALISLIFMSIVTMILLFIILFKKEITRIYGFMFLLIYILFIYLNFIK